MRQVFRALTEGESESEITHKYAQDMSTEAAAAFVEQFKRAGFKILDHQFADGWGISSATIQMMGVRVPILIGVQNLPKGVQMHVEFQSPMTRGPQWEALGPELFKATKAASNVFRAGGAEVNVGKKGKDDWPYVWIYPGDDVADDVKQFPGRVRKFATDVAARMSQFVDA